MHGAPLLCVVFAIAFALGWSLGVRTTFGRRH